MATLTYNSVAAIIVAAGSSTRFGAPGKVFEPLLGQPVLEWSLAAHDACPFVGTIVVVGQPSDEARVREACGRALSRAQWLFAPGGSERQESVANGLAAAGPDAELISIHDAARPGVTPGIIAAVAGKAREEGAAVAAVRAKDTIKECDERGAVLRTLDRSRLWQIATPQAFCADVIREAHAAAAREGIAATDDAALVERLGWTVVVVEAEETIAKITTPRDMAALSGMLGRQGARVGFGYDIHATSAERKLFLGGVEFPEGPGLAGHSDADVICHAAADALLGAAGLGDIGRHFPNTDERYAGVSSLVLLQETARILGEAGFRIVNVDVTLIAERPKIAGRVDEMRARMGAALGVSSDCLSVKATTAEKQGPAGRGECMEAHAVALVSL